MELIAIAIWGAIAAIGVGAVLWGITVSFIDHWFK